MINVSELAAGKLKEIMEEEGENGSSLRIHVMPGAQGGAQYSLSLEDAKQTEDTVIQANGVQLLVDRESFSLLEGSEIDYVDGLMRSGFVINNPNFVVEGGGCGGGCACGGNCGCGAGGDAGGDAGGHSH